MSVNRDIRDIRPGDVLVVWKLIGWGVASTT